MTPLEIHLVLNLYHNSQPYVCYPVAERITPAMYKAFERFYEHGLLSEGVTFNSVMIEREVRDQFLSTKGMLLVERLMDVQP